MSDDDVSRAAAALARASAMGHRVVDDQPFGGSCFHRYTCVVCGCAVILRPDGVGSFYGSAADTVCREPLSVGRPVTPV